MKFNKLKRLALFGTSADPPTTGHKKILEELGKIYSYTVTYASNNPQKTHREDISIRSLLLKALIKDLNNSKIIFNQKISSQWAIESIKKCKSCYGIKHIDFVIGSDLIIDIFSWKNFDKIIKEANLFIILREGYPIEPRILKMLKTYKVEFEISSFNIPNISSSMIKLNKNYSILPSCLIDIVNNNNLYKHKQN